MTMISKSKSRWMIAAALSAVCSAAAMAAPTPGPSVFYAEAATPFAGGVLDRSGHLTSSPAAPGPVNERNRFLSGLQAGSLVTEGFSSTPPSTPDPDPAETRTWSIMGGAGKMVTSDQSRTSDVAQVSSFDAGSFTGRFNMTGGSNTGGFFETDASFTVSLNPGTLRNAFGVYLIDLADFGASVELLSGTQLVSRGEIAPTVNANGNVVFFGFYSDVAFDSVRFVVRQNPQTCGDECPDIIGIDDLIFANVATRTTPMSLPGTLALAGLGLFGIAAMRRRS